MIKTLAGQVKEFKKDSILTPFFMILEVIMEMIIPLLMSSIIDDGVERGDIHHIYIIGIWMVAAAGIGLFAGVMGGNPSAWCWGWRRPSGPTPPASGSVTEPCGRL